MTNKEAIKILQVAKAEIEWSAPLDYQIALDSAIEALEKQLPPVKPTNETPSNTLGALDCVERRLVSYKLTDLVNEFEEILSHIREREENDSVCGLCKYGGAYMGQSGDWCNECPGFDKADCFKLKDKYKKEWLELMNTLPSVHPDKDLIHLQKEQAYMQGYEDGQKPRKGKWKRRIVDSGYNADWICSECGHRVKTDFVNYNFCPHCGADMKGEQDG